MNFCRKHIMDILLHSEKRVAPGELIKMVCLETGLSRIKVRQAIKKLTGEGEIAYTYDFGSTYMELSFSRPVRITEHFTLLPRSRKISSDNCHEADLNSVTMPPNEHKKSISYFVKNELFHIKNTDIEIIIDPGISFGSGRHPTTKLCIEAMEHIFFKEKLLSKKKRLKAVDIGTGSGVLAIAAVKAGISECLAVDTDPSAVFEAKRNVKLNRLEKMVKVTGKEISCNADKPYGKYSLICANLRFPTLKKLLPLFLNIASDCSVLILSGVRIWETGNLIDIYSEKGFKCLWEKSSKKWSGLVFYRSVL